MVRRGAAAFAVLLLLALPATAQRLIAVTQALSATREAAALYVHSVDMRAGVLPGAEQLLGDTLDALHVWPGGHAALAMSSGPPLAEATRPQWWRGVRPVPFSVEPSVLPVGPALAGSVVLKTWEQPGARQWLARIVSNSADATTISFQPWKDATATAGAIQREVPGHYITGAPVPGAAGAVFALIERARGQFAAVVASVAGGALQVKEFELRPPAGALDPRPEAALVTEAGAAFVLFGGYDLAASNAQTASWLAAYSLTGIAIGAPLKLFGAPQPGERSLIEAPGGCWCVTREPGRDAAYATLVTPTATALEKTRQYPIAGARGPLLLAAGPGGDVLAAIDRRLECWPGGERNERVRNFDAPVRVLLWSTQGPVAAIAGQIHLLESADLSSRTIVQCQSGEVAALAEIAPTAYPVDDADADGLDAAAERALICNPDNPDSDGDGLHDGADPEPAQVTPSLLLPSMITFNGDAAGQELHALLVRPATGEDTRWQITYNTGSLPWLRLYPTTSYGTRTAYVGIDPLFHSMPAPLSGVLHAAPMRTLQSKAEPPGRDILLVVRPPHQGATSILWMLNEDQDTDVAPLRAALTGPPLCFAHRDAAAAAPPLDDSAILVLGTTAAARGDLTQHALINFVSQGGALLVVPEAMGESTRDLSAWFAPLGFKVIFGAPLSAPYVPQGLSDPVAAFTTPSQPLRNTLVADDASVRAQGADPNAAALYLRQFGLGRVAAVADAALLLNPRHEAFASALFRWLSRAGLDLRDLDGDGLLDDVEDANQNQATDPGETDRLNPDTDSDGLGDGLEDRNRNGRVDDGETDPRNPDSDGDGILDGSDPTPCPALGAPRILSATPATGPAEGGTLVTILGQNFDNSVMCYFGEHAATVRRVAGPDRLEVAAPPSDSDTGGPAELRIEMGNGARANLPNGFAYGPRSTLRVGVRSAVPGWKHDKIFNGILGLTLEATEGADLGQVVIVLEANPFDNFSFKGPRPGPAMPQSGRYIQHRLLSPHRLLIVIGPDVPAPFPMGEVLRIPWEYGAESAPIAPIHIAIASASEDGPSQAAALARLGGALRVEFTPFDLEVSEDPTRSSPRP